MPLRRCPSSTCRRLCSQTARVLRRTKQQEAHKCTILDRLRARWPRRPPLYVLLGGNVGWAALSLIAKLRPGLRLGMFEVNTQTLIAVMHECAGAIASSIQHRANLAFQQKACRQGRSEAYHNNHSCKDKSWNNVTRHGRFKCTTVCAIHVCPHVWLASVQ